MALIINNRQNIGDQIGEGLGSGLSQGIQQLLSNKMNQMVQHQQQSKIASALQALNIPNADKIALLPPELLKGIIEHQQQAPSEQAYGDIARSLFGNGQEEQNQPFAQMNQQQQPSQENVLGDLLGRQNGFSPDEMQNALAMKDQQSQPQQIPNKPNLNIPKGTRLNPNQFTQLLKVKKEMESKPVKPPTAAQLKLNDALVAQDQNLEDIIDTTDRMLETLTSGQLEVGVLPSLKASIAPTSLNNISELFDKDASHIVNLTTENIKGVPSKLRVGLIQKEKPGLSHSIKVNEQILKRLNKSAKDKRDLLRSRYTDLFETPENKSQNASNELPDASKYPNKIATNKVTGERMKSVNGKWVSI